MPYQQITDLPESVRKNLPEHAQHIFLAAFNSALEQYGEEERAFRVAWSAVERDYEKGEGGRRETHGDDESRSDARLWRTGGSGV